MTTTVGFVGLGIMGGPMAANLVKAGFDVVGHNRSPEPVRRLEEAGGRRAGSLAEAVADAEVVITMLPDSPDVEAVALAGDGIYATARPGTLHVDMSTIRPDVARRLAAAGQDRGLRVLDAPVSGGQQGAVDGTLELVAEALVFLEAAGVDTGAAVQVLAGGLAGSTVLDRKGPAMLARDFTPGFRVALHHKDMGIVTSAARAAGVVIPLGAVVAQLLASLDAQGHGALDHAALLKLVEQLSGRGGA